MTVPTPSPAAGVPALADAMAGNWQITPDWPLYRFTATPGQVAVGQRYVRYGAGGQIEHQDRTIAVGLLCNIHLAAGHA